MVLGGNKQDEAWQDTLSKFLMKLIKIGSLRYQFPNRIFLGLQTHTLFKHYLNGKKEVNATWKSLEKAGKWEVIIWRSQAEEA